MRASAVLPIVFLIGSYGWISRSLGYFAGRRNSVAARRHWAWIRQQRQTRTVDPVGTLTVTLGDALEAVADAHLQPRRAGRSAGRSSCIGGYDVWDNATPSTTTLTRRAAAARPGAHRDSRHYGASCSGSANW